MFLHDGGFVRHVDAGKLHRDGDLRVLHLARRIITPLVSGVVVILSACR